MALETFKNVKKIGKYNVVDMGRLKELRPDVFNPDGGMKWEVFETEIRPSNFIYVRPDKNSISFTLQNWPINIHGVNGCQVDTIIEAARIIIAGLNEKYPCRENSLALTKLDEAILWLQARTKDRIERGVEGYDKI